jgi:hypothetical protein
MNNEELDKARADEAWRLWQIQGADHPQPAIIAARLAREGWMPPVDPDLLAVREIVATAREKDGLHDLAGRTRTGDCDNNPTVTSTLAAYKAGKEARS